MHTAVNDVGGDLMQYCLWHWCLELDKTLLIIEPITNPVGLLLLHAAIEAILSRDTNFLRTLIASNDQ